jgi:serine phosphatase RsbU (regulator of sigma subunit)
MPASYADVADETVQTIISRPQFKDITNRMVYGPTPELRGVFFNGHIDWPSAHEIFPLYRSGPRSLLPALAFSGNIDLKVESGGISAIGKPIPLTRDGSLLINWLNPDVVYAKSMTLLDVVSRMNSGSKWPKIRENSHIVILPQAFTGSADFVSSPYGPALGGMVHASVLNSILMTSMLYPKQNSLAYLILLVLLAVALQRLRGMVSWVSLFSIAILITLSGLLQFIYQSQETPWVVAGAIFLLSGVSILSVRSYGERKMTSLLFQLENENERLGKEELRLSNEMAEAAKIAQALVPEKAPEWPNYWVSEFHKSATDLSGDWYFFESSASGRFGHFVMCDITGHGVQAAIVVSCCKTILTSLRMERNSIFDSVNFGADYTTKLNSILFEHGNGRHSTTLLALTFDFYEGKVYAVNCGHTFPVWHKYGEKQWSPLLPEVINDPLGFQRDIQIKVTQKQIEKGDSLIIYSDGTMLNRHRRLLRRYFEEMNSDIRISAKRLHEAANKEQMRRGMFDPKDDVSIVIFKRFR